MPDNKDLNQRFDQLEKRLESMAVASALPPFGGSNTRADEIDLRELFKILWQGKWWIIGITFLFAVAGVFYASSLPNIYKSEGVYSPTQQQGSGGAGGQFGGLAAMAGINLGGEEVSQVDMALKRVVSWPFVENFIEINNVKPFIFAIKSWDSELLKVVWDVDVYDPDKKVWTRPVNPPFKAEPSSYEAYEAFKSLFNISIDKKSGLITATVEHYSPEVAHDILVGIIKALNDDFKLRDLNKAKANIKYLEDKIVETKIADMQTIFYGMIEDQLQSVMLAEVAENYLLESVVEPKVAEFKSGPKRALLCIIITILGGVISSIGLLALRVMKT
ncbi:Wzz/FepE/Etk N-terminal domain-containing protein [Marinagarivorans algicola]|uniref:Wzz/FepE/Etk N-terminal domain-containing protein n=1 Tax=Marinagarivorans algicola TaxID=1513270 RepID=UPI0037366A0E